MLVVNYRYNNYYFYRIEKLEHLGSGQFGDVYKGRWSIGDDFKEVAIKTLKRNSTEEDKVKFLQEAAIMGQFHHPNVVKLHGVVTSGNTVSLN